MSHRKRVGLALGGGVVRGLAHIGVLSVLEQSGIPIDFVAGTSAGSLIGAVYCAGMDANWIKQFASQMSWGRVASLVWPKRGFISFDKMARWLIAELGDLDIRDLKIPYATIAADLETGQPVKFLEGRLAPAVQASCSVPGIVTPVELNERLLGDGSLVDTIPVTTLREMGADYVIGVDIFSCSIYPRLGPIGMGFTALEILVERAGAGVDQADCLIKPKLGGMTYLRFSQREKFIALGEQAACEKLDRICADLRLPLA